MSPQSDAQTVQTPPPPPAAPSVPVALAPAIAGGATDYRTLSARRSELSRQLNSVEGRREELLVELRKAPTDVARAGVEARLKLLDERILQIETDIAANGRALAANPRSGGSDAGTAVPAGPPFRVNGNDIVPGVTVISLFVLAPIAFAMARRIWRGGGAPTVRRDAEGAARLERIEQAVDAIAIEIERISEGQRYQAKLLGEGAQAFAPLKQREAVPVGRDT